MAALTSAAVEGTVRRCDRQAAFLELLAVLREETGADLTDDTASGIGAPLRPLLVLPARSG